MRYIIFSFDDGMADFKTNAYPILRKYGFKSSLNIISGFSDKTIKDGYDCLNIDDIKNLFEEGVEMANHTNSHFRGGSFEELLICNDKLNEWCSTNIVYGVVMPKYVKPGESAEEYIEQYNPPYVGYEKTKMSDYKLFLGVFGGK